MVITFYRTTRDPLYGLIAGALPDGLTTFPPGGTPGPAQLDLFDYDTRQWLRSTWSTVDGTYAFDGLFTLQAFGVWVRDPSGVYEDMVAGRVYPYSDIIALVGSAPNYVTGVAYSYQYVVQGGAAPFSFAIVSGALPDGISLDPNTGELSGTPTDTAPASWEIEVTDSRANSFTLADSTGPVPTYSFIRLVLTSPSYGSAVEIEMSAVVGGADLCTGGTPFASSTYSGYPASLAFDDSLGTGYWCSSSPSNPQHIGYEFASPQAITEVRFTPSISYPPTEVVVQGSNDGSTWDTLGTFSGLSGWVSNVAKSFTW